MEVVNIFKIFLLKDKSFPHNTDRKKEASYSIKSNASVALSDPLNVLKLNFPTGKE